MEHLDDVGVSEVDHDFEPRLVVGGGSDVEHGLCAGFGAVTLMARMWWWTRARISASVMPWAVALALIAIRIRKRYYQFW